MWYSYSRPEYVWHSTYRDWFSYSQLDYSQVAGNYISLYITISVYVRIYGSLDSDDAVRNQFASDSQTSGPAKPSFELEIKLPWKCDAVDFTLGKIYNAIPGLINLEGTILGQISICAKRNTFVINGFLVKL